MKFKKIFIIGISGTGKSYLSKKLAKDFKLKHYDLDDIFWLNKYDKKRGEKDCESKLNEILKKKSWIVDGVYSSWTKEAVKKSDIVIWLHYPIYTAMFGAVKRHFKSKEKRESLNELISLLNYIRSYKKIRNGNIHSTFEKLENLIKGYEGKVKIIKSRKELEDFLTKLYK